MIIVAGDLHVDPADRAAYLRATFDVAAQARAFPGCLDFVQAADPLDPSRINVYERWESDADVEAFRTSGTADDDPSASDYVPSITSASVQRFRISAVESP